LRLAERQIDEADMTSTGGIMLKSGATITVIAAVIAARAAFAQVPPTDTELRAAFCIGALDAAVASDSPLTQPPPPSLPPAYARLAQEENAKTRRENSEARERLRRFLLPSMTIGRNPLSLRVATNEGGGRVFGDCLNEMNSKAPGPACTRTRRCFHLDDWLPY
jgi:hypothetical protein